MKLAETERVGKEKQKWQVVCHQGNNQINYIPVSFTSEAYKVTDEAKKVNISLHLSDFMCLLSTDKQSKQKICLLL